MSSRPGIEIEGARALRRDLKRAGGKELTDQLKAAHRETAEEVAKTARPLVPVRTGRLRKTLRTTATVRTGRVVAGRQSVPYAGPIHFGWPARNISPNPFIYDALDRRRDDVVEVFRERIGKLVDSVTGGED